MLISSRTADDHGGQREILLFDLFQKQVPASLVPLNTTSVSGLNQMLALSAKSQILSVTPNLQSMSKVDTENRTFREMT